MFRTIEFLSLEKMRLRTPREDAVVVSILDIHESQRRPDLAGWGAALSLTFEDTYEECKAASTPWPDEPSDAEHARFAQGAGERVPALSDAKLIAEFLLLHGRAPGKVDLLVHCFGGISRSAAVAQWASVRFFTPMARVPTYPNLRLLRLLDHWR